MDAIVIAVVIAPVIAVVVAIPVRIGIPVGIGLLITPKSASPGQVACSHYASWQGRADSLGSEATRPGDNCLRNRAHRDSASTAGLRHSRGVPLRELWHDHGNRPEGLGRLSVRHVAVGSP